VHDDRAVVSSSEYLFDNEALEAGDRFGALAALFDPVTFAHLERLGTTAGWRCLEVGAGGGSIASWLGNRAGASGHVLATDLDVRWLESRMRATNVEVRAHNVVDDVLPEKAFDLVHERLVLIHIPERVAALGRLVSTLRPGGWLLAEDFDAEIGSDAYVGALSDEEALGNRIVLGVRALLAQRGADTALGHKLPQMLRDAGLEEVGAEANQVIERGDAIRRLQRANIAQVSTQLLDQGVVTREELDRYLALLDDGTVNPRSPLLVSAWGRRPLDS
jgi:ubiquinone/menaquinone biosynthesis C-methylase UbiE